MLSTSAPQATLTTIGTAQLGDSPGAYKIIWDDDNNGQSLVWLDVSGPAVHNPRCPISGSTR